MRSKYIFAAAGAVLAGLAVPRVNEARPVALALASYKLPQEPDGKGIYLKECKQCHGVIGAPTKTALQKYEKIPDLSKADFFKDHPDKELLDAITNGKGRDMKSFSDRLEKEEIHAVLEYVKTLGKK